MIKTKKENDKNNILIAIAFNIGLLLILLIFFEPTIKSDDYDLSMVLYGAISGEYSPFTMYVSYFFSKTVAWLMSIKSDIPWFFVLQYVCIFFSLVLIMHTYIKNKCYDKCLIAVYLLSCGYELYIRLTFTKTSGIIIFAGCIFVINVINQEKIKWQEWVVGVVWILIGCSIRRSMLLLILEVCFSVFIVSSISSISFCEKKKLAFRYIVTTVIIIIFSGLIGSIHSHLASNNLQWNDYYNNNGARAKLQDYYMPEYEVNSNQYKELGLSNNDYIMYKEWALYNDYKVFSVDTLREIDKFDSDNQTDNRVSNDLFKNFLSYYFSEPAFYVIFFCLICLYSAKDLTLKEKNKIALPVIATCFLAYSYMFDKGRTQHHVDVIVLIAGAGILLFYYFDKKNNMDFKYTMLASIVLLALLAFFYNSIYNSSYYEIPIENQKEFYANNRKIMDDLSADKEHVYVFCAYTNQKLYDACFLPYEIIPRGYYSNLDITSRFYIPDWMSIAERYGIDNYYEEATNSDIIYFVCLDENEGWIECLQEYINEHYNDKAQYELVKETENINIYRFVEV